MTAGIGHNSGQTFEAGQSWRKHVWTKARKNLMPTLPIEAVRLRVRRAQALGLPYQTYAGIRASSGHDLIGFMFSSNALHVLKPGQPIAPDRARQLDHLRDTARIALAHAAIAPDALTALPQIDAAFAAPAPHLSWSAMRDHLKAIAKSTGQPADRFILVGETALERSWAEAMQAAAYLSGDRYFAPRT